MIEELRDDGIDDMALGISEGGLDGLFYQHILGAHQIPWLAVCGEASFHHHHIAVVYLSLEHLIRDGIHHAESVRLAGENTVGHTDEHISHRAHLQRTAARLDTFVGGESIVRLRLTGELYRDRQIPCRGLLHDIEHTCRRTGRRSGIGSDKILVVVSVRQLEVKTETVVIIHFVFDMITRSFLQIGVRAASGRVTQDIEQRDGSLFFRQEIGRFLHASQYVST